MLDDHGKALKSLKNYADCLAAAKATAECQDSMLWTRRVKIIPSKAEKWAKEWKEQYGPI